MSLPSLEEAIVILRKAGCSEKVVDHCLAVSRLAREIAERCNRKGLAVDVNLVEVGSLLHDLGRSRTHGITHAVVGGEMAKNLGLSNAIVRIIERHLGAGISADEAKALGLPEKSYIPETLEEKIVSYADKLIEGRRQVKIEETITNFEYELGPTHPSIKRMRDLQRFFDDILRDN